MSGDLPTGLSPRYWQVWRPSGTGRINDSLQAGEEWIGSWDGLGLYEGNNKIPGYQLLVFHLTTHRLLLEPYPDPSAPSSSTSSGRSSSAGLSASLAHIRQTEFYTGFMRSSAKITLSLGPPLGGTVNGISNTPSAVASGHQESDGAWTCTVCGLRNGGGEVKCGLCGVGKDRIPSRSATPVTPSASNFPAGKRNSIPIPTAAADPASIADAVNADNGANSIPAQNGTTNVDSGKIACPACTFLNHSSMTSCEICSTPLPRRTKSNGHLRPGSLNGTSGVEKAEEGRMDIVRLSFRKGGEKVAYAKLKSVLSQKAWERQEQAGRRSIGDAPGGSGTSTPRASAGIDGILQTIILDSKNRSDNVSSAFADLEVLMVRAGEMVKMAQSYNDRLLASQRQRPPTSGAERAQQEEEATLIRTSLVQLGLPAPALTSDMVRSDKEYLEGLARELGALLTGHEGSKGKGRDVEGLMVGKKGRGVIGLDEVWGLWMRARGVVVSILPFLPDQTSPPIRLRTLPSGLKVLFSPTYAPPNIHSRLLDLLSPTPHAHTAGEEPPTERSLSLIEIAAYEGLAIGLARELMDEIEKLPAALRGGMGIVRDDQAEQGAGGTRWYRDIITQWTLET